MTERARGVAALVAMVLIWGYSWVMMKVALRHAHPFDFAALRVLVGAVILFGIVKLKGRGLRLPRWRMVVFLGLTQVAAFVALSHFALLEAGPGKTSVLVFTMPFWMIVFAHFLIGERMHGPQWLAVGLAFVGLVLIVAPWELKSVTGSVLAVAAGDPLLFTAWQLTFGFLALFVLAMLVSHRPIEWNTEFVVALGFSAVLATAIGWWLWTWCLAHTPAGILGLNSLGIPVVAVVSSAIQLGERPDALELIGMLLIGTALGLLSWLGARRAARAQAA